MPVACFLVFFSLPPPLAYHVGGTKMPREEARKGIKDVQIVISLLIPLYLMLVFLLKGGLKKEYSLLLKFFESSPKDQKLYCQISNSISGWSNYRNHLLYCDTFEINYTVTFLFWNSPIKNSCKGLGCPEIAFPLRLRRFNKKVKTREKPCLLYWLKCMHMSLLINVCMHD